MRHFGAGERHDGKGDIETEGIVCRWSTPSDKSQQMCCRLSVYVLGRVEELARGTILNRGTEGDCEKLLHQKEKSTGALADMRMSFLVV